MYVITALLALPPAIESTLNLMKRALLKEKIGKMLDSLKKIMSSKDDRAELFVAEDKIDLRRASVRDIYDALMKKRIRD